VAFDGLIAVGMPLSIDLSCCPHSERLLTALSKADATVALALLDQSKLSVKSGKFKATINCILPGEFYAPQPDPQKCTISDVIKEGLDMLIHLVKDKADRVIECSFLFEKNSLFACNGHVAYEYWHGLDLPYFVLPKHTAKAIIGSSAKLTGFGCSDTSVTFYFDNGAWLKSQCFEDKWPDVGRVFGLPKDAFAVPPTMFEAFKSIEAFCDEDDPAVYFYDGLVGSQPRKELGATFEIDGLPDGSCFNIDYMLGVNGLNVETMKFENYKVHFFGERTRATIMARKWPKPADGNMDDDVPF
jgi:hypothetical protein